MPTHASFAMAGLRAAIAACFLLASPAPASPPSPDPDRAAMVERIRAKAAADFPKLAADPHFDRTLAAVAATDRAAFVPAAERAGAYGDTPLPIGHGQTISDAFIVSVMTAAAKVEPGAAVLEIGTGSGYQAAILARLGARVHSVEIVAPLARSAARRLRHFGYRSVAVRAGDGFLGWPAFAPYDAIIVTAGAAEVPAPLLAQLRPGGTLVMPIGAQWALEQLLVVRKGMDGKLSRCTMGAALFVPLTGRGGRPDHPSGLYDRSMTECY